MPQINPKVLLFVRRKRRCADVRNGGIVGLVTPTILNMGREHIRKMRRAAERAARADSHAHGTNTGEVPALLLLQRSMELGHGRLAVRRLLLAVRAGASVLPEQWHYCLQAAAGTGDALLRETIEQAFRQQAARGATA